MLGVRCLTKSIYRSANCSGDIKDAFAFLAKSLEKIANRTSGALSLWHCIAFYLERTRFATAGLPERDRSRVAKINVHSQRDWHWAVLYSDCFIEAEPIGSSQCAAI